MLEIFKLFTRRKKIKAVSLLQRISKRAEDLTAEEQAKSFVSIRNIDGTLLNRDNRILFGRRGTGKTHILSYVAKTANDKGDIALFIDLRTVGSNNSIYSDNNKPDYIRATHLLRDLFSAIHDRLMERYTAPNSKFIGPGIAKAIDDLAACVRTVSVDIVQETKERRSESGRTTGRAAVKSSAAISGLSASFEADVERVTDGQMELEVSQTGSTQVQVNMGKAYNCLNEISRLSKGRIWLLLDEWSSVPEQLQPYLADFLRRAAFPVPNISVQIAAIEFRSRFRADVGGNIIGFEVGSDVFADINLDDYFVYDNNPKTATDFFKELLFRHLQAFSSEGELEEPSPKAVVDTVFSQDRVFGELVRASEGVPRDFINILQIAAMRSDESKISMDEIRVAAKDWFERDKQRNLDVNKDAQNLLEWIRDRVIFKKKARAFLVETNNNDEAIEFLFDERVLHIAKRSYSAQDDPGVRYRVWKVDYGCYVDLMNTVRSPTGFLFADMEIGQDGEIGVPDDDFRAVRRAILDLNEFRNSD